MKDESFYQSMMHGEVPSNQKGKLKKKEGNGNSEDVIDKEIDAYVDAMEIEEEDQSHPALQSQQMKRAAIKQEIREAIKLSGLNEQIILAITILNSEGIKYLSGEANQVLQEDLVEAATRLAHVGVEEAANINLQTLAHISDESIQSIVRLALAKFTEGRYNDCLALFSLLTLLNPAYWEYWFRLGIVAQKCENDELASRAFAATLELNPNNIGARIFAAQCFIKRKMIDEAKAEIDAAKKLSEEEGVDQMWRDLLPTIEGMIE